MKKALTMCFWIYLENNFAIFRVFCGRHDGFTYA